MNQEEKIMEAALTVVKEQTISGTRMHLIAEKAGMLQSNLHYYYKTKNDLMDALQEKVLDKCLAIREKLREKALDSLESQMDIFINQKRAFIMDCREYDFAEVDFWVQGRIHPNIKRNFANSFEGWRQEIGTMLNTYVPDLSDEVQKNLPYIIVSYLEGATMQYLIDEDAFELDEYFRFGKQMILDAIKNDLRKRGEGHEINKNNGSGGTCIMP